MSEGAQKVGATMHKRLLQRNGQNLLEYAIVVALVLTAMIAMSTYVFRSAQAGQQMISREFAHD